MHIFVATAVRKCRVVGKLKSIQYNIGQLVKVRDSYRTVVSYCTVYRLPYPRWDAHRAVVIDRGGIQNWKNETRGQYHNVYFEIQITTLKLTNQFDAHGAKMSDTAVCRFICYVLDRVLLRPLKSELGVFGPSPTTFPAWKFSLPVLFLVL